MDEPYTDTVEETLLRSGRPVLWAPAAPPAVIGETVAVGWNGSAEAVRAPTASLPFLASARAVSVINIGEEEQDGVTAALEYLAWHGIVAKGHTIQSIAGTGKGAQLLAAARDHGADLLVVGGYGHAPWREFLIGGATREVVATSPLPLLLSH